MYINENILPDYLYFFRIMSNELRLKIIVLLMQRENLVRKEIMQEFAISDKTFWASLQILRKYDMVRMVKMGNATVYRLSNKLKMILSGHYDVEVDDNSKPVNMDMLMNRKREETRQTRIELLRQQAEYLKEDVHTGFWIPKKIWDLTHLRHRERLLLAEICAYEDGCYLTNKEMGRFLGILERYVRESITDLRSRKLIREERIDGKRVLYITVGDDANNKSKEKKNGENN